MPIYEYRCQNCEERFEKLVRMSTPVEEIECPHCQERQAQRLMSTFSGRSGGFYSSQSLSNTTSSSGGGCGGGSGFT